VALMEAMACGIPVIGTQTGGIPSCFGTGPGWWSRRTIPRLSQKRFARSQGDPHCAASWAPRGANASTEQFRVEAGSEALEERFRHFAFGG
jgi:glycosyltransferase involved in cell wall biosynthesis